MMIKITTIIFIGLINFGFGLESDILIISHDPTAVLDAPINFYARLENPSKGSYDYDITWNENTEEGRSITNKLNKTNGFRDNITLYYPSGGENASYPGAYSLTATVRYYFFFSWHIAASMIVNYSITSNFTGKIEANQLGIPRKEQNYVSTLNETELYAHINVDQNFLKKALNVSYAFYNSTSLIVNSSSPILKQNITKEGTHNYNVLITALFNNSNPEYTMKSPIKYGNFSLNVTAKDPVINFTVAGATWFPHGNLFDVIIKCDGTGPFSYCWSMKTGPYNITGNENCSRLNPPFYTTDCKFPITWYFSSSGSYSLLIIMDNDVSHMINQTMINVYNVTRKPQLSIIVVPLSCTIVAIVLIVFGVAYYYENHIRYSVEVADFDFGTANELPYMTFSERLRVAISSSWLFNRYNNINPLNCGSSRDSRDVLIPNNNEAEDDPTFSTRYGTIAIKKDDSKIVKT